MKMKLNERDIYFLNTFEYIHLLPKDERKEIVFKAIQHFKSEHNRHRLNNMYKKLHDKLTTI